MDTQKAIKWLRTSGLAALGGGVAAVVATAADPQKYRFPQDLGSGKMWPYFATGIGLTFAGLLLKSPIGQSAMTEYKKSQDQLEQSRKDVEALKEELKPKDKSDIR